MLLAYYMEDTKVKKRIMVEPSTWWLRAKNAEKDENAILSTNFAKTNNVKPGIHENKVLKCISCYTFSNNQLLRVERAFDSVVTVWSCDHVGYGRGIFPDDSTVCCK